MPDINMNATITSSNLINEMVWGWDIQDVLQFVVDLDMAMGDTGWSLELIRKLQDQTDSPETAEVNVQKVRDQVDRVIDAVADLKETLNGGE